MSAKSAPVNEGDWICADKDCGNINFTWRARCNRCGKEKGKVDVFKKTGSEIGKSAAAKSGGLFSAEDWQCSKCGNVNWARRNTCNICNEPKFGKVEARTGFGGGYNERDEFIEYKERDDSDGELDEFGRKKKRLRKSSHVQASKHTHNRSLISLHQQPLPTENKPESQEEEDEEDSGSDEDISKYDLLGDDDDDNDNGKGDNNKSNHGNHGSKERRARSRSSSDERYYHHHRRRHSSSPRRRHRSRSR